MCQCLPVCPPQVFKVQSNHFDEDTLAGPDDVARLMVDLKDNPHVVFSKEYEDYSHLTWMVGLTDEWINDVKALLRKYNPITSELVV